MSKEVSLACRQFMRVVGTHVGVRVEKDVPYDAWFKVFVAKTDNLVKREG